MGTQVSTTIKGPLGDGDGHADGQTVLHSVCQGIDLASATGSEGRQKVASNDTRRSTASAGQARDQTGGVGGAPSNNCRLRQTQRPNNGL
jgi:hypothetical protein